MPKPLPYREGNSRERELVKHFAFSIFPLNIRLFKQKQGNHAAAFLFVKYLHIAQIAKMLCLGAEQKVLMVK